jgi:uncharacterized protein
MIQPAGDLSPESARDLERLTRAVERHGSMIVAYSGGVDSALLAYVAHRVLGDDMLAVTGVSPSFASRDAEHAAGFLERHAIPSEPVQPDEMKNPDYRANGPDRCFFCKEALFVAIDALPSRDRFAVVAYGANLDDGDDHRPGARSASRRGVAAPLSEAGLSKASVRALARGLGLEVWDRPAAPCLASRIPYHTAVTGERLRQVERAEQVLDHLGFIEHRVRHYGETARVELPLPAHACAREPGVWKEIENGIRAAGFKVVELEADGLRSGRLNDVLGGERPA